MGPPAGARVGKPCEVKSVVSSVTPLPAHKEAGPDSKEGRLSSGSLLDMLAQLNDQTEEEEGRAAVAIRPSIAGVLHIRVENEPSADSTSPNSNHLSPINPLQLNELLTSF